MISTRYLITIIIVLNFLIFPVFISCALAQEEQSLVYTLESSISIALGNNWSIKGKEEKIREAEYKKNQAKTDFYPKFSTTYGYTRLHEVTRVPATPFSPAHDANTQDNFQWKGSISQTLFAGYALLSAYELSKLGIDQAQIELELEKLDIALKVKEAYFNILRADKGIFVAEEAVQSLEAHVEVASNFYEVGMIPINDLLKSEVELGNARYELIRAKNAARLARAAFNVVLANPVNDPVQVKDILTYKSEYPDFDEYLGRALMNRPEIKALDINQRQVEQQVRLAKSAYYPAVSLNYDYTKAGDDLSVSGSSFHDANSWQITAGLSWTLWQWGKRKNAVLEKESLLIQLVQTKKTVEEGISLELKQSILNLEQAQENIPTTEKAVEQAEENLRVSQERYKAQVTTTTEVLDAQTLLAQARKNYYNALYDHHLAKAALTRAIGTF